MIKKYYFTVISIFIVVLDLITKNLIKSYFAIGESKNLLGSFLRFTFVENSGIAFGLFSDVANPESIPKNLTFTALNLAAISFIIYLVKKSNIKWQLIPLFFILGGAFGNLLERIFGYIFYYGQFKIFYGRVVDFIDFGIGTARFHFFNVADSFITVGVIWLLIFTLFFEKKYLQKHPEIKQDK